MEIGEDVTVRAHDEPGAFALHRLRAARAASRIIFIGRALEKQIVERGALALIALLRDLYDDDAGRDDFENFRKGVIELVNDIFPLLRRGRSDRRSWSNFRRCTEDRRRTEKDT